MATSKQERFVGDLVTEIIDGIDADEFLLFGYDWGGQVALRVGVRYSE